MKNFFQNAWIRGWAGGWWLSFFDTPFTGLSWSQVSWLVWRILLLLDISWPSGHLLVWSQCPSDHLLAFDYHSFTKKSRNLQQNICLSLRGQKVIVGSSISQFSWSWGPWGQDGRSWGSVNILSECKSEHFRNVCRQVSVSWCQAAQTAASKIMANLLYLNYSWILHVKGCPHYRNRTSGTVATRKNTYV